MQRLVVNTYQPQNGFGIRHHYDRDMKGLAAWTPERCDKVPASFGDYPAKGLLPVGIVLSDLALQNVQRDLAYQLAFVVLWAEAVRTSPPSADAPESLSGRNGSSKPR